MKYKKLVVLSLMGMLSLGSVSTFAMSNEDKTETNNNVTFRIQATKQTEGKITKEKATQIMKESLEQYFGTKIEDMNLKLDVRPSFSSEKVDEIQEWIVYWRDEALDSEWTSKDTSIIYGGSVDAKTGKITHISVKNGEKNKVTQNISVKEIKDLGIDFIKKHNLVESLDKLKLLGEYSWGSDENTKEYVFSYGEKDTEVIYVKVDLANKSVSGFAGGTVDMEHTKELTE